MQKNEFSEMNQIVTNKCKMLQPFSSEHLPSALQKSALVGYIPLYLPVSGKCHSECHMGSMCMCGGSALDSFPLIKMIVLFYND